MEIDLTKELMRIQTHLARAQDAGLPATLTLEEWVAILKQFQGMCAYCETIPFDALNHLIPLDAGEGGTIALNCVPACKRCNSRKCGYYEDRSMSPAERLEKVRYALQYDLSLPREAYPETKQRKAKLMRLTEQDIQAILKIRQAYGIASDNQAIIYAIHVTARQLEQGLKPQTPNR